MRLWTHGPVSLTLVLAVACGGGDDGLIDPSGSLDPPRVGRSSSGTNDPGGDDDVGDDDTTPTPSHGVIPSFGEGGVATVTTRPGARVALAADGRTLLLQTPEVATTSFEVIVLDANGQPDLSYGSGGQTSIVIPSSTEINVPTTPQIDVEGRILVPVRRLQGSTWGSLVARVAAGSLDATFGSAGVWDSEVSYSYSTPIEYRTAEGLQGYFVTVSHTGQPSVARLDASGQLVSSYGSGGSFAIPNAGTSTSFKDDRGTMVLGDGALVLVSWAEASDPAASRYWLRRVTPEGTLDSGYGSGGKAILERPSLDPDRGAHLVATAGGNLVGIVEGVTGAQLQTVRATSAGAVSDGFNLPDAAWRWLRVQDDQLLMWNATTRSIQRWNAEGVVDTSFAPGGTLDVGALVGAATNLVVKATDDGGFVIAAGTEQTVDGTVSTRWEVRRLAP